MLVFGSDNDMSHTQTAREQHCSGDSNSSSTVGSDSHGVGTEWGGSGSTDGSSGGTSGSGGTSSSGSTGGSAIRGGRASGGDSNGGGSGTDGGSGSAQRNRLTRHPSTMPAHRPGLLFSFLFPPQPTCCWTLSSLPAFCSQDCCLVHLPCWLAATHPTARTHALPSAGPARSPTHPHTHPHILQAVCWRSVAAAELGWSS